MTETTVAQEDLFGAAQVTVERAKHTKDTDVVWLPAAQVQRLGVDSALRLLGVPRTEAGPVADWRDEMMRRAGVGEASFRRWFDWEVNILGNRSLAAFIWEIA